jgi:hypothetical protein
MEGSSPAERIREAPIKYKKKNGNEKNKFPVKKLQ